MPWRGRHNVAKCTNVVAPWMAECCSVELGDGQEVTRAHPSCGGAGDPLAAGTTAIAAREQTDVEQCQPVDCREAEVSEDSGGLGEQRARAHCPYRLGCLAGFGDPGLDVGVGRHHVVVE
jgi:hypothetical protein